MSDLTQILRAIEAGDGQAAAELLPLVYDELRELAEHRMRRESPDHTLEPTALVHEAYIRLVGRDDPGWQNRGHFFAAAAEAMRRILIESARQRARLKHGGGLERLPLTDQIPVVHLNHDIDVIALDDALAKLEAEDPAKAKLVELRFFAGLSVEQAAAIFSISRATADRWWTYARAFLYCEIQGEVGSPRSDLPVGPR
jgi:RNA polymerase sigma factor (TIGR02999 family)